MIDLHLHTTASDGSCPPGELVARVRAAGISVMAVTDHDTGAALAEIARLAPEAGILAVPGIEITAVWRGRDVHVLAYFIDPTTPALDAFLRRQRADRERRGRAIAARLDDLGLPVDIERIIGDARPAAVSRPLIAAALVAAGHAGTVDEAFDRYLGEGGRAYVPRIGATPDEVVALVNAEGGAASLAHPGVTGVDEIIPRLTERGLAALEAYHPDHDAETVEVYLAMADRLGLAVTGGSDYHGTPDVARQLGDAALPLRDFERFCRRAGRVAAAGLS